MASANVFAGFLQPARSVFDYQQQLGQIDAGNVQTQAARQQLTAQADQLKREEADRNAFAALMQQYQDPQAATQAMLRSPSMTLYQKGMTAQKAQLDARKTEADINKDAATTAKTQGETVDGALARYRSMLDQVQNPQMAAQWLQAQYSDPQVAPVMARMGTLEQAMSGIPQDPQGFEQWRQRSAMGIQKFMEAQRLGAAAADTRANQMLVPGPDGTYTPNLPLIDAKKMIAKAGASKVEVNTGQKGLDNERNLRNDFRSEQVVKDFGDMQLAHKQVKAALSAGTPIGDTAGATKIMKLLDPGSVVRESELGIAMAASGRMDRMKNMLEMWMNGTKLTPTQRQEFASLADELMSAAGAAYNQKHDEYTDLGGRYKLDTGVLGPRWSPTSAKPPAKPGKPGAPAEAGSATQPSVSNW